MQAIDLVSCQYLEHAQAKADFIRGNCSLDKHKTDRMRRDWFRASLMRYWAAPKFEKACVVPFRRAASEEH